ncbi:hypothetical protein [Paracoccus aminophilus]|uniref:Uncharacterized protein n=1 Tax=Paracoccus aminophilus JCM 7686 TaxID=1367847 RepID=S5XR19_PARAH|nr:hypothetical protein [Paracoccus aminophilus]AGT09849.1 hypothetical protein JCM7686_2793 [Paracoccus aminophilus JCM 7686]
MPESLVGPSEVYLFGRVVDDLKIVSGAEENPEGGSAGLVERQLRSAASAFARIYGFSHDGLYHVLPRPALFLVQGEGVSPASLFARDGGACPPCPPDFMVWAVDRGDVSIRLDVQTGPFEALIASSFDPRNLPTAGMSSPGMSSPGMSSPGMSFQGMSFQGMSFRGMSYGSKPHETPPPSGKKGKKKD